jgi:endonuclease/exonuclease/phosphatase (EEP) superfamily protein YafD
LMIFSRVPLNDVETRYFDQFPNIPTVFFNLSIDGKNYRVAAGHAAPPVNVPINMAEFQAAKSLTMTTVGEIQLSLRNAHLRAVADWISTKAGSILVVGDLNTTPYSHAFENFISTSGLKDARKGRGFLPTWGPLSPWPLRLPIDHILLSKGLEATSLNVGPDVGSDHRPLIAVLKPSINALVQKQTD